MSRQLNASRPFPPELEEFKPLHEASWDRRVLTNGGSLGEQIEVELSRYLSGQVTKLSNYTTSALHAPLPRFDLLPGNEVITTPLAFAATAHSIFWNGLVPVFADVSPDGLTLDPESVWAAVTENTSAVLGVSAYGAVCQFGALQDIADLNGLTFIHGAAHAFGCTVFGRSIGDAFVFSVHAIKQFHTFESGMITIYKVNDGRTICDLRNYCIKNEQEVDSISINGKLNQLSAAIGLLSLSLVEAEHSARTKLRQKHEGFMTDFPGITLQPVQLGVRSSEQYFILQIDPESFGRSLNEVCGGPKPRGTFNRKYFHPICTDFKPCLGNITHYARYRPKPENVQGRVFCLPFHAGANDDDFSAIEAEFFGRCLSAQCEKII